MAFHLEKETHRLRQEVFHHLSVTAGKNRLTLLKVRDLLWTISMSLVFKDKEEKELLALWDQAMCLMFKMYETML
jgi:hypothetical protein